MQLDDPAVAERQLDRWQQQPRFRGVGISCTTIRVTTSSFFLPSAESLRRLAERGIPFDVPDAWPRHLAATADLAAELPDLRIVVDHLGKPPYGGADWEQWRSTLGEVAAHPNTTAKVSGLQVPGRPFTVAEVRPAWQVALELFGPEPADVGQRLADNGARRRVPPRLGGHVVARR